MASDFLVILGLYYHIVAYEYAIIVSHGDLLFIETI